MTNTYAINTTRNQEFEVERELLALGLKPWVPKLLDSRYVKERREVVWYDRAYVPKLAFCVIPAVYWNDVIEIKHILGKPQPLSRLDINGVPEHKSPSGKLRAGRPGILGFKAAVEAEYEDATRRRQNADYRCIFKPGQALELLHGPFEGFPAEFKKMVKRAGDEYEKLQVGVMIFGRETLVDVDPDKVGLLD